MRVVRCGILGKRLAFSPTLLHKRRRPEGWAKLFEIFWSHSDLMPVWSLFCLRPWSLSGHRRFSRIFGQKAGRCTTLKTNSLPMIHARRCVLGQISCSAGAALRTGGCHKRNMRS